MKWGRKKPESSSSSSTSSLSHVFPISWLSGFKHKSEKTDALPPQTKPKCRNDTFYGKEEDAFQRLSFGGESLDGKKSRGVLKPVRYESDYEMEIPRPSCQSCRSKVDSKDSQLFNNMVSEIRNTKQLHEHEEILPENDTKYNNVFWERKLIKKNRGISEEKLELKILDEAEKIIPSKLAKEDASEWKPKLRIRTVMSDYSNFKDCGSRRYPYYESPETRKADLSSPEEDHTFKDVAKWENREKWNFEDLKGRRSLYISKELQRRKTRRGRKATVQSPRTPLRVESCKIKVIEDRKKTKMKTKNKIKEKPTTEVGSAFERFAVVKFSYDLQQDFRESMVEMIKEKGITRPEELEELLACYLTLNSDEYHGLIIKVFRQVWIDMNQPYFDPELQSQYS